MNPRRPQLPMPRAREYQRKTKRSEARYELSVWASIRRSNKDGQLTAAAACALRMFPLLLLLLEQSKRRAACGFLKETKRARSVTLGWEFQQMLIHKQSRETSPAAALEDNLADRSATGVKLLSKETIRLVLSCKTRRKLEVFFQNSRARWHRMQVKGPSCFSSFSAATSEFD